MSPLEDYNERRHPTSALCPRCLPHGRQSVVMAQKNGGEDYLMTCSDHTRCNWHDEVKGTFVQGDFYLLYRPRD